MPSASQLRTVIENKLSQRIPAALSPPTRVDPEHAPLCIPALEETLEGLPVGALCEITGVHGSGRTALACAAISTATQAGQVVAWVDVSNAFDPASAAANQVQLDRMLWVRCGQKEPVAAGRKAQGTAAAFATPQTARVQHGGGSPHPRSEARGLSEAVNALLASPAKYRRDRVTGTPGAHNRRLHRTSIPRSRLSTRIEHAGTDRQPSRRGTYVLDQRELFTGSATLAYPVSASVAMRQQPAKPWDRIDQALRVTDLLLQAGGFSVVVLDLADIAAEFVSRIPMATWFRFRAGAEHAQSALVVLTQHASTGSSAALMLKAQGLGELENATYFPGLRFSVEVGRRRFAPAPSPVPIRKPPQRASAAEWSARSIWGGAR